MMVKIYYDKDESVVIIKNHNNQRSIFFVIYSSQIHTTVYSFLFKNPYFTAASQNF